MKPALIVGAFCLVLPCSHPAAAAEIPLGPHRFTVPPGFTVEIAASSTVAPRPIAGSFDPDGRLYVTDSAGLNLPPAEQLKAPKNRILRLEDTDGDGTYDRSTVFADKVMFPQGCLWHGGSVYVAGPPSIWKFTDTDGDGVADKREEWYQGKVLTGCANDVHGPYLGPEGMLYWTKGAFARVDFKEASGRPIQDRCAHVFRAWPDMSGFESVISGGMDNPVEVAFTAEGEPVIISTFIDLSQPGRRDGLAHAVWGGVFGKINDVVDEPNVRRTGGLMPVLSQVGPAAACALMRYQGDAFGPEYRDNLFGTLFNLRKVTRHVLRPNGASYTAEDSDFLVSDQMDFHPTDVLQDADGSLLVVDTGGWYKLCCPSSQLAKADVMGTIFRVRKLEPGNTAPRRLDPAARRAAYARLAAPPSWKPDSAEVTLKQRALKADPASAPELRAVLEQFKVADGPASPNWRLARLAAEGLGRMRDRASVPTLLKLAAAVGSADRFLEHSLLYAVIEIGDAPAVRSLANAENPAAARAALLTLEQIEGGQPRVAEVLPALNSKDAALRDTGAWVARRHPEWGAELTEHLRSRLSSATTPDSERSTWESQLGLIARHGHGQAFLAELVKGTNYRQEARVAGLSAMSNAGLKDLPEGWRDAVTSALSVQSSESSAAIRAVAVRSLRSMPFPKEGDPHLSQALHALARQATETALVRLEALSALPAGSAVDAAEFAVLRSSLDPARPPTERLASANALGRLKLEAADLRAVLPSLGTAGPIELPKLIAAYGGQTDEALGNGLIQSLKTSKVLRSLRAEDLKPHLAKFPESVRNQADALLASVQSDASQDRVRLDQMLAEVQKLPGDVRRGQALFNSTKAACSSCHRQGYLGGDIGPDLTAIGTIRTERDLLEAVIYPSASFVRSYEPWIAVAKDGEEYSGVLRRDTPDEIVLATGPGAEARIARSNLSEIRLGTLSTMPAGLDEQLSRQELSDLLAFLKNTKWGVN
ncbi:MAG: c-type cytochrome [Verrucomicrobiales bacterium]|nr:c-type cytochrome [Verrucomicrobiales bacterium]